MLKRYLSAVFALGVTLFAASCAKEGPTGPTGPAGPAYTGTISGHIKLYDQYGSKVLTGLDSITISLVNGAAIITADATGYYGFNEIATSNYNLSITDSGYAATFINEFQFVSGTLTIDAGLSKIPNFAPTGIAVYNAVSTPGDSVVVSFAADTRGRNAILFVNSVASVSNSIYNYTLAYTKTIAANATQTSFLIPAQDIYNTGLTSGAKIYYAAYGYVVKDASAYEDLATGKEVYNAVSTTAVIDSAIIP